MGRVQHYVTSSGLEHAEHRGYRRRSMPEQERDGAAVRRRRISEQRPADTVRPGVQIAVVPLMRAVANRQRLRPPRRLGLEAGGDRLLDLAPLEGSEGVGRPRASATGRARRGGGGFG